MKRTFTRIAFLCAFVIGLFFSEVQGQGTIAFATAPLASTSTCGLEGIDANTLNGTAVAGGTYQWQSSTTSAASGFTNVGTTTEDYNPGVATVRTWYRRVHSVGGASNVLEVNPVGGTQGTVGWVDGRSCVQQDTLSNFTSGLFCANPYQWSWQADATTNTANNCNLSCPNATSQITTAYIEVVGGTGVTSVGQFNASSGSWIFNPPGSVYCKRLAYVCTTATSLTCYVTTSVSESFSSVTNVDAGRDGIDPDGVTAGQTVNNLRTVAQGHITNSDGSGTWTYATSTSAYPPTSGSFPNSLTGAIPDDPNFTFASKTARYYTFRYINGSALSCCADTSFYFVRITSVSLPLEINTFQASMHNQSEALLSWDGIRESSVKGMFEIERRIQGETNFSKIGQVEALGEQNKYDFIDKLPNTANTIFYRLKIIGQDDKFQYTGIKKIDRKSKKLVDFYPTIVLNDINLELQNEKGNPSVADVKVFDLMGRMIQNTSMSIHGGYNKLVVDLSQLNAGTYVLRVSESSNNINTSIKFVKQD